jgi:hypothetical protein
LDTSSLHAAIGAVDFAIESLSNLIKSRTSVKADRTLGDILDQLIAAQALLRRQYLEMRDEADRLRSRR